MNDSNTVHSGLKVKSNNILYIGRFGLPNNAAGIRVFNNALIFKELGYDIFFACLNAADGNKDGISYKSGFKYIFKREPQQLSVIGKIKNILDLIFAFESIKWIKGLIKKYNPSIIILYNDLFAISYSLRLYCKNRDIKLIADVTEWYEHRKVKHNLADYFIPLLTDKRIRFLDPLIRNVIAISPYLNDFYKSHGCNVIMMPPVFDIPEKIEIKKFNYYNHKVINFIYAGSPGAKDILLPFITSLFNINSDTIKIRLDIIGVDYKYVYQNFHLSIETLNTRGIFVHGKVPHSLVVPYFLSKADFGLLLRNKLRFAKAGFSTKLAECMSVGVAIFANEVGGAETLITNGVDGLVIDEPTEYCITNQLNKLLAMQEGDILKMRIKAFQRAKELFMKDAYVEPMRQFLS